MASINAWNPGRWAACLTLAILAAPPAYAEQVPDGRTERLDRNGARRLAEQLMPIVADDVIDGERILVRTLRGVNVGLVYRFRLRPESVRSGRFCRLRTIILDYEFNARDSRDNRTIADFDLLAMKRSGQLGRSGPRTEERFLALPSPGSGEAHAAGCIAANPDRGWLLATDESSYATEHYYLERLRAALRDGTNLPDLRCRREEVDACQVSGPELQALIERPRREFRMIRLLDGTVRTQFVYYDDPVRGVSGPQRTVEVEVRGDTVLSVLLFESGIVVTGT